MPRSPKHPWSKLQKRLYLLIDPQIRLQVHCRLVRMQSAGQHEPASLLGHARRSDHLGLRRRQFVDPRGGVRRADGTFIRGYPYSTDVPEISDLIPEYIDMPVEELQTHHFERDHWAWRTFSELPIAGSAGVSGRP